MEQVYFKLFVFCAIISLAYSFMCYECGPTKEGEDYSTDQCEKDQKKVNCSGDGYTCYKLHGENTDGIVTETRGCWQKSFCEVMKKTCSDDDEKKKEKIKECEVACCVSTGDTPCNSASTAATSMMIIMVAALCSLKLF